MKLDSLWEWEKQIFDFSSTSSRNSSVKFINIFCVEFIWTCFDCEVEKINLKISGIEYYNIWCN